MTVDPQLVATLKNALQPQRLRETALQLVQTPSPTRSGAAVAEVLSRLLEEDGFEVERPIAGWPEAPAVAVRYERGKPGKTLQFNGHLDTVHLPFVPPRVENGSLYGSGAIDMKGGIAAMVEALRMVRDSGLLASGGILLTAHDLHESPWGDGSQIDELLEAGYAGDGALIPEYLSDVLPLVGRGLAILEVSVQRPGEPVHEVLGGLEQPNVIAVGADIVRRLTHLDTQLQNHVHPSGLRESVFVGQIHAGEIFNQSPTILSLSGTRRWLPGADVNLVRQELHNLFAQAEENTGTHVEGEFLFVRDAFELDEGDWLTESFQAVSSTLRGAPLPTGVKPFVDDGNTFSAHGIPCITHGPAGKGAHTLYEEVPLAELERVALWYALTALIFCDA